MIFILFVDHVQETPEGPIPKRRRTGMGETSNSKRNVNVSETEETAMDSSVVQPPEAKESEALGTPVLDKPAETPSTSFNDTEGNNFLFYYSSKTFLKIINPNICRSISRYDHFRSIR